MDSFAAMALGEAARRSGAKQRVFDWDRDASLIAEKKPVEASAGLSGDWSYTGGDIWRDGSPVLDSYTYLSSNWAEPELDMDGDVIGCWKYADETPGWDSDTKWPASALAIVSKSKNAEEAR